ncbi:alpha/beta hydrolase [Phycicoccus sp. BSK3Z-2]|uniref:Alpha/beta hydrolase n=1 Tax=Phycicoccus avicenniae TaxID=2828860 RepID=A0A941DAT5_9MICO|nr:alpha/beta hydrolase [Phycicoccus avicenniae]MBR7744000.1 alpha/beta hydrolase [Phycicoccus avicenniae]
MTPTDHRPVVVLVPGAWMGAWIWEDTVERLHADGHAAETLTLRGLGRSDDDDTRASTTLEDHVLDVVAVVERLRPASVVLVGHSYSGAVVGQVADRMPDAVAHTVHVGSFLPRAGRSLLDDWGDDEEARGQEKRQVRDDGDLWAAPPAEALEMETDLDPSQRQWLLDGFVPHPGRTVLDPAVMVRPVTSRPATFVADAADDLPPELAAGPPEGWTLEVVGGGHWPMLTRPEALDRVLREAVGRAGASG